MVGVGIEHRTSRAPECFKLTNDAHHRHDVAPSSSALSDFRDYIVISLWTNTINADMHQTVSATNADRLTARNMVDKSHEYRGLGNSCASCARACQGHL